MSAPWNRNPVKDEQWRPLPNITKQMLSDEQDSAAGGRDRRIVIDDKPALGRVVLQLKHKRIYAELRWQSNNRRFSRHLGEVTGRSRAENLAAAWKTARDLMLVPSD